ncbi:MAG: hypothetical protein ACEPOV_00735 [Hyphomicrobiales bacterium]
MIKRKINLSILTLLCMLLGLNELKAQSDISSPYSKYGIGKLNNDNTNIISKNMGGIGYGIRSSFINPKNPASYAAFDSLSFHFDAAVSGSVINLKDASYSSTTNNGTVEYLTFGFPVTKWLRTSFGILPYSSVGYRISKDLTVMNSDRKYRQLFNGEGGLNRFYIGNAFKINDNFFLGFNAYYLFGNITHERIIDFSGDLEDSKDMFFNSKVTNQIKINNFYFDLGIQGFIPLKKDLELGLGMVTSLGNNLNAKRDYFVYNYYLNSGNEVSIDTVTSKPQQSGTIKLPLTIGGGISLEKKSNWMIGADLKWGNWKNYKTDWGSNSGDEYFDNSLQNSLTFSMGGYYLPDNRSIASFWKRSIYRFGFRYGGSYINISDKSVNEFGISLGASFPYRKSKSSINLGFEYGGLGKVVDNLVEETFFKFSVGISIQEKWFVKYKYR